MADVLIVEDDHDIRADVAEILREEGHDVQEAANGAEALVRLRSRPPPDLVLLDLMMPVMDGFAFRAEQEKDESLRRIPIVVVSGDGNVRQKAAALRAAAVLEKPFRVEALLDVVARFGRPQ